MPGRIYMLIGLARSGKSTIAKAWGERRCYIKNGSLIYGLDSGPFIPRVVVNADQIRLTLHGKRFCAEKEEEVWRLENFILRNFFNAGYHVLADETHTSNRGLMGVLRIDIDADYYVVDTPVGECKRRAIACGHEDLVTRGIIDRMDEHWSDWKNNPGPYIDKLRAEVKKER